MTDINFNITGIESLIEDFNKTRCECDNRVCVNNAAWSGRNQGCYAVRCLLPSAHIDEQGKCQDIATVSPNSEMFTISSPAIEAAVKHLELLKRVVDDCDLLGPDRYVLTPKLFEEIKQALGRDEE